MKQVNLRFLVIRVESLLEGIKVPARDLVSLQGI